jgi:hypothetical protein
LITWRPASRISPLRRLLAFVWAVVFERPLPARRALRWWVLWDVSVGVTGNGSFRCVGQRIAHDVSEYTGLSIW